MFRNYIFRLGALLSLLILARLADRAQQTSLAAAPPARAARPNPALAQPLAGPPAYLLVSQAGR